MKRIVSSFLLLVMLTLAVSPAIAARRETTVAKDAPAVSTDDWTSSFIDPYWAICLLFFSRFRWTEPELPYAAPDAP